MSALPKISELEKGAMKCPGCGNRISLGVYPALQVVRCLSCGRPEFIPGKIKDYWLFSPLGSGGMGCVYKAISTQDNKFYAVKVLPENHADEDLITNLIREGDAGLAIDSHPNLIPVIEVGQDNDDYFIASEFVQGDRLDIYVEQREKLSEEETIAIARQIVAAEMHICRQGYLFRDLKPQNVIIEPNGNVRIFDYGLCIPKHQAANPQKDNEIEGSPFFIPPERVLGDPEDEYSEIYSLGLLMFYMLDGKNYYKETTKAIDIVMKHVRSVRLSSVGNKFQHCLPRTIKIIDIMMDKNPRRRFRSFKQLAKELDSLPTLMKKRAKQQKKFSKTVRMAGADRGHTAHYVRYTYINTLITYLVWVIVGVIAFAIYVWFAPHLWALRLKSELLRFWLQLL